MRLVINDNILNEILEIVSGNKKIHEHLVSAIEKAKKSNMSNNKVNAIKKTNELRVQRTKDTILKAIEEIKRDDKVINPNRVAKITGLNYNTVHKYFRELV